jgi:hypothetical protein
LAVTGAPNEWVDFIDSMVPDILKLVIAGWNEIPRPSPDEQEDHITNALCTKIRQHRTARNLPFQIHTQFVELEPANNEKLGRLDIVFIPLTNREDIYFCLECKRLNVVKEGKPRSYASEYVSFGMMRFITGQYSKAVRHGGMTGYVLNSNLATAIKNVEANIKSRCSDLKMKPPGGFAASSVLNNEGHARETHHHRSKSKELFSIHHLFVSAESLCEK